MIHRAETVYGLGDFLAGFLSALMLAAVTRRRLYVDSPFDGDHISFAPYNVAPPEHVTQRHVLVQPNRCPPFERLIGTEDDVRARLTYYEGRQTMPNEPTLHMPANRACAWSWHKNLTLIWTALAGEAFPPAPTTQQLMDHFLTRADLVYGCPLRLFKPQTAVTRLMQPIPMSAVAVSVHLRSQDASFNIDPRDCPDPKAYEENLAAEVLHIVKSKFGDGVPIRFQLESDNECVRRSMVAYISRHAPDHFTIAPRKMGATHNIKDSVEQQAAWFSFADADLFIVSPMHVVVPGYEDLGGLSPQALIGHHRRRGIKDHGLLRLSSWSLMAAIRAGSSVQLHVLCTKPPPPKWDVALQRFPNLWSQPPLPYVCDSTMHSAIAITTSTASGPPAVGPPHVNAHFLDPETAGDTPVPWGVGTFK